MTVNLKMQWRPQEIVDARNVECLLGKAAGDEQNQPKTEAMWATNGEDTGARLPHITSACAPDVGHRATEVNVCLAWFLSCFGLISIFLFLSFGMGIFTLCHWKYVTYFLFYRGSQLSVCLKSQRTL
jgi:hypothetical protein